jgi:hypothetical protein
MQEAKLFTFIQRFTLLLDEKVSEGIIFTKGKILLEALISEDDWLPEEYCKPHPEFYQQYLLFADPLDRFSVVSFVWGPGQKTPIHNHTVWGMVGQLRGEEKETAYHPQEKGGYQAGRQSIFKPGQVAMVSPSTHDIHVVENNLSDKPSISIHVYGGNIGKIQRAVFHPETGAQKLFVSGYANVLR